MIHPDFHFEFVPSSTCHVITVEDTSSYSIPLFTGRGDYGFALFWTDGVTTGFDFTNPLALTWPINFPNNGSWTVYMFMVPLQDAGPDVYLGDIRFFNGDFYLALQAQGAPVTLPPDPVFWQLLSGSDLNIFIANWDLNELLEKRYYGEYHNTWVVNCDEYNEPIILGQQSVYQVACHQFRVDYSALPTTSNIAISVWNLNMTERLSCLIIPAGSTDTYADVTTPADGVYIVEYGYQLDPVSADCEIDYEEVFVQLPIYDFCNPLICFNALVQMLLCNELDPCCRNCDPEFIEKRKIYREELNKMMALMFQLYALLNIEQLDFVGYNIIYQQISQNVYEPFSIDRNMILDRVQDVINKLSEITGRCGDCDGPRTNLSTTPCTNCGGQSNV